MRKSLTFCGILLAVLQAGAIEFLPASFKGVVTLHRHGDPYFFVEADDSTAWRCEVTPGEPLPHIHPGDLVEVSGVREDDINRPRLFDAKWRVTGHDETRIPKPMRTTVGELYATATNPEGGERDWYAKYMAVEGIVRDINRRRTYTQIQLGDDTDSMQLSIRVNADIPLPEYLAIGAKVRSCGCGIYTILRDQEKKFIRVNSFALMVQGFDGLEVLSRPPWWTPERRLVAMLVGFLALLASLGWGAAMTAKIHRERDAAKAIARDRKRMAADLHDTIEQYLASVKLMLAAALNTDGLPEKAKGMMLQANDMLAYAKGEVRTAVMDLRGDDDAATLENALKGIAESVEKSNAARVRLAFRALPERLDKPRQRNLLMIVREAVTNAVKHGRAKNIVLASDPERDGFVLRILNDGEPFDRAKALGPATGHYGLAGMEQRARKSRLVLSFAADGKWTFVKVEVKI